MDIIGQFMGEHLYFTSCVISLLMAGILFILDMLDSNIKITIQNIEHQAFHAYPKKILLMVIVLSLIPLVNIAVAGTEFIGVLIMIVISIDKSPWFNKPLLPKDKEK